MNNTQRAAARRAQRRYPEVAFRATPQGVQVKGVLVPIPPDMSPEDVFRTLMEAARA